MSDALVLPPEMERREFIKRKSLGQGALYKAFVVEDEKTHQKFVCKKSLHVTGTDDTEATQSFLKQVVFMSAFCDHLCCCGMIGYWLPHGPDETARLFLEYFPKGDLQHHILRNSLNKTQKYVIAIGVCLVMIRMHQMGVVFGDLKPQNIFVDENGIPKVSGFGFSEREGTDNTFRGAPLYMAPEYATDEMHTSAVDVYAFAIVLYQLFVRGRMPGSYPRFMSPMALLMAVKEGQLRPEIPEETRQEMADLIRVCWSQEPADRPMFTEVARALLNLAMTDSDVDFEHIKTFIERADGAWLLESMTRTQNTSILEKFLCTTKYDILEAIGGEGSTCKVYAVKLPNFENVCAGKRFNKSWTDNHRDLFEKEIEHMGLFNSSCIVKLFGYVPPSETSSGWIFMELLESALKKAIVQKSLNPTEIMMVLYGIAVGMCQVHEKNLVHLDLKPENVMLDKENHAKIVDFGITTEVSMNMTVEHATPFYMAPEVGTNSWGQPADVYSFALIMYQMLIDKPVCPPRWRPPIWQAQVRRGYRPSFPDTAQPAVQSLISECWNHDPSKRPKFAEIAARIRENVSDFVEGVDLERFQGYCESLCEV